VLGDQPRGCNQQNGNLSTELREPDRAAAERYGADARGRRPRIRGCSSPWEAKVDGLEPALEFTARGGLGFAMLTRQRPLPTREAAVRNAAQSGGRWLAAVSRVVVARQSSDFPLFASI